MKTMSAPARWHSIERRNNWQSKVTNPFDTHVIFSMQNSSKSHHAASHIIKDEIHKVILNATHWGEGTQDRYPIMLSASDSRRFSSWATVLDWTVDCWKQLDLGRRGEPYRLFGVLSKAVEFAPVGINY
jgi:hypothetical protein